jgi:hypothetical protein
MHSGNWPALRVAQQRVAKLSSGANGVETRSAAVVPLGQVRGPIA